MVLSQKSGFNRDRLLYSALRSLQTTSRLLPKIEEVTGQKSYFCFMSAYTMF